MTPAEGGPPLYALPAAEALIVQLEESKALADEISEKVVEARETEIKASVPGGHALPSFLHPPRTLADPTHHPPLTPTHLHPPACPDQ